MQISLAQAIEIHAKALNFHYGKCAAENARKYAVASGERGDRQGVEVWLEVAEAAERLLRDEEQGSSSNLH
jgi:hypothetical protein